MKLKISISLFIFMFSVIIHLYSQNNHEYVRAINGLIIREFPLQSAKKITNIPFGEKVFVTEDLKKIILVGNEYGSRKKIS